MWDERYSSDDYVYGTAPNDFLVSVADRLPGGRVLCLGEGEGRNAVWLAQRGLEVTAVDGTLTLLADDSNLVLPRLFESATQVGARITSVEIQEPNLEAVFLHLTGRGLRD